MKTLTAFVIILFSCSAWAGDCMVHRADSVLYDWGQVCSYGDVAICKDKSHWVDTCAFTVREVCDTTRFAPILLCDREGNRHYEYRIDIACRLDTIWNIAGMGLTASPSESEKTAAQIDSLALNIAWLRKNMPTKKDFAALRRWSLDQDFKTCIDTMDGIEIIRAWWRDKGEEPEFIRGEDARRVVRDSCECLVYGKKKTSVWNGSGAVIIRDSTGK